MKRNKSGVSLIVLVITIIVMIILASAVIISLSNTNIFNKANEAVDKSNLQAVQNIASLAYGEAYIDSLTDSTIDNTEIEKRIWAALENHGITKEDGVYDLIVTDSGVEVIRQATSTLGELITSGDDYGTLVDYSVITKSSYTTSTKKTYDKWRVYYEDEENGYVFIVSDDEYLIDEQPPIITLTQEDEELYKIFSLGTTIGLSSEEGAGITIASLVCEFSDFANTEKYGEYVIGAIGSPTLELLAAGWNKKVKNPVLTVGAIGCGATINDSYEKVIDEPDGFYVPNNEKYYYLTTQNGVDYSAEFVVGYGEYWIDDFTTVNRYWIGDIDGDVIIRPTVCLKASTPAVKTANGYELKVD